jgi:polysaccharide biosynthesis/export protein
MLPARLRPAMVCILACALLFVLVPAPPSRAQTVETSQQTNDRLRSLAAASRIPTPTDYVIGTGDLVGVQVFDVPELSRDLRVSQTGTIGIPLIPVRLHVAGLTELQAEHKIEEVLEANGLISHPEVSLAVREKKSRPITVVGAVGHPMVYSPDRQVTLVEVLAEAGGIGNDASDHVIVTRPEKTTSASDSSEPPAIDPNLPAPTPGPNASSPAGGASSSDSVAPVFPTPVTASASDAAAHLDPPQISPPGPTSTITVNLSQILESGDLSSNIVLLPGDVVTVPHAGIVYVLGAVARPGGYSVSNDRAQLSTLKLLSLAGGLNSTAKSNHAYIVRKDVAGKQSEVEVDLKKVMKFETEDIQLRPSDVLYVPTSGAKVTLQRVASLATAVGTGVLLYRVTYR